MFVRDLDAAGLDALAGEDPKPKAGMCDVSKRREVERVVAVLGGLDVPVNNAGVSGSTAPVEGMDPDARERVMRVNPTGTFDPIGVLGGFVGRSPSGVVEEWTGDLGGDLASMTALIRTGGPAPLLGVPADGRGPGRRRAVTRRSRAVRPVPHRSNPGDAR